MARNSSFFPAELLTMEAPWFLLNATQFYRRRLHHPILQLLVSLHGVDIAVVVLSSTVCQLRRVLRSKSVDNDTMGGAPAVMAFYITLSPLQSPQKIAVLHDKKHDRKVAFYMAGSLYSMSGNAQFSFCWSIHRMSFLWCDYGAKFFEESSLQQDLLMSRFPAAMMNPLTGGSCGIGLMVVATLEEINIKPVAAAHQTDGYLGPDITNPQYWWHHQILDFFAGKRCCGSGWQWLSPMRDLRRPASLQFPALSRLSELRHFPAWIVRKLRYPALRLPYI